MTPRSAIKMPPRQGKRPPHLLSGLLFLVLLLLPALAGADSVRARMTDGSTLQQSGLVIESFDPAPGGGTFNIRLADGAAYKLPVAQAEQIIFGDNGEGRHYDLVVGMPEDAALYQGSLVFEYSTGKFRARPLGEEEEYYLATNVIRGFTRSTVIPPTPAAPPADLGAFPPPEAAAAPASDNPFGAAPAPDTEAVGEADPSEEGLSREELIAKRVEERLASGAAGSTPFDELLDEADSATEGPSGGLLIAAVGLSGIYVLIYLVTLIWLASYAFKNGFTGWGIALIVLSCCLCGSFAKAFFLGKYDGPAKGVLTGLVWTEILLNIGLFFLRGTLQSQFGGL